MAGENGPITVLHVDDEPAFLELTADFLTEEDDRFVMETERDPEAALESIEGLAVDCVVSDYEMPGLDGIELLEAVREDHPDLPFVLFTGKGSETVASEAISAGVTDYVQKKAGASQYAVLANRIANAVEGYRSAHEAAHRQHRVEQIVKTVPACVVQIDADGQFVFANERAEEVLGLEPGEVPDRTYNDPEWDIRDLDGEPIPDEELPFRQVRDGAEPIHGYRHSIVWPDGTRKVLQIDGAPLFDGSGTVESTIFALSDITDRIEREEELRRLKEEYQTVFETAQDAIFLFDVERDDGEYAFRLRHLNPAHEAISGLSTERDRGKTPRELLGEETGAEVAANYRRCVEAGEPIAYDEVLEMPAGTIHWRTTLGPVVRDGEVVQIVGVARDVTDRKERERRLERQNERLEQLAGVLSHDLRNPLNLAQGRLKMAADECESEHLDPLGRALERMDTLVSDLLTLARAGVAIGDTEPVSLPAVAEACWETVGAEGGDLVVEADGRILADGTRFRQLVENCFRNAIQHGGDDVTVTVGALPNGFYVADDGRGFPDGEPEAVLEPGYSTADDGTGFGLSIVADIAEAHDWTLTLAEGPEGGARLEFTDVETG